MALYDLQAMFRRDIQREESESGDIQEAVIGIVTDNKDPDKLGRVRVKIPTINAEEATWWCPLAALGGGKQRGWFFIPEVDDEVLVMFVHGKMSDPIVLGALWNGKDKPPDTNPGGNPRRLIKSRGGARVVFDDDKNQIIIEDGGGAARITFDAGQNHITLEALTGDLCIQAPTDALNVVAQTATLEAGQAIEASAGHAITISANGTGQVTGRSLLQLTGSGGQSIQLNNGGGNASRGSASPQDVADKYGS